MRVNHAARAAAAQARRERTRERLLDAAEGVIAEKGAAISIEELVRAAAVSRGTFYNYFPSTTDLIHALNLRVAAHISEGLQHLVDRTDGPAVRLAATLHTVFAAYRDEPVRGWVALQLASSRAPRQSPLEQQFAALYREGVHVGCFRNVDLAAAVTVCFGTMRMAQRDVVAGVAAPVQSVQVVALVLAAFGVPYEEAERISRDEAAAARG